MTNISIIRKRPESIYKVIKSQVNKKIKVPLLKARTGGYSVKGLSICFFASNLDKIVTKKDLIDYLKRYGVKNATDPQPRHLGLQNGFNFLIMNSYHPRYKRVLKQGEYCLRSLKTPHPSFRACKTPHRTCTLTPILFNRIKRQYDMRCAHCGSKEGDHSFKNKTCIVSLEKGHRDPTRPLNPENCIPICQICNKVYKNKAIFNERGFITKWLKI